MAINQDRPSGRKLPPYLEKNTGTFRYDPGPYVGVVKDNRDPTRLGRLRVWIPDFGGDEDNSRNWTTVFYASPYIGTTSQKNDDGWATGQNSFSKVQHSYGMWFPVPDLNNLVVCLFIAGDPNRGIWFAGMLNQLGHHMVPAIGASDKIAVDKIEDSDISSAIEPDEFYPVAELNEFQPASEFNYSDFTTQKKPLHEPQVKILLEQGLDRTKLTKNRGAIKTTSQREAPSTAFGFSSPGRPHQQPYPKFSDDEKQRTIRSRTGGHTFVMDDGDQDNKNNLTRWRSAGGHEILMDDEEKVLYVINSSGSIYIEFADNGMLNVYAGNNINIRTKKDLNLHVDNNFNLEVGGDFKLRTKGNVDIESSKHINQRASLTHRTYASQLKLGASGQIELHSKTNIAATADNILRLFSEKRMELNSNNKIVTSSLFGGLGGIGDNRVVKFGWLRGPKVDRPNDLPVFSSAETIKNNLKWQVEPDKIKSISNIVPTHEPWPRQAGTASSSSNAVQDSDNQEENSYESSAPVSEPDNVVRDSQGEVVLDESGNPVLTQNAAQSNDPGIQAANSSPLTKGAPDSLLKRDDAPNPPGGVGNLSKDQTRGLMTQISYNESGGDYKAENQYGFVGRYQMGAAALVDSGYISRAAYEQYGGASGGNKSLNDPSAWTGKDGIGSKDDFKNNSAAQENAMYSNTKLNYDRMLKNGGIKPEDDPGIVGGMLQTAHLLGSTGAKNWRNTGSGQDANNTTGSAYFNRGRYGTETLGGKA